jgi:predicted PurR-regulated permease PerM
MRFAHQPIRMADAFKSLNSWITFAGCILVIGALYWAQAVLVPICLAILLTFVLTPPVKWLQRRVGRLPAILTVFILVFSFLGLAGYGVYRQMSSMSDALPTYRSNIRAKIRDIRGVRTGEPVKKFEQTLQQLQGDLGAAPQRTGTVTQPIIVTSATGFSSIAWLGPFIGPLSTAGFVATLVLFMLLEREDLRDRLIGLFGHGQLAVTTKAIDEAAARVSHQLLLQTVVNLIYGALMIGGLYVFGVPYALFWGAAGAALRFIPYVGPVGAAAGPILIALAALPGWRGPIEVAGFFVALELFTNLVLETVLYAGAAGVSQVALLVAIAFWTWLWGPLGLILSTPVTVCLVVMSKHVPGLQFLNQLMSDVPALSVEVSYYQRLIAGDQAEAAELIDRYVKEQPSESVYDAMLVPALNYAERDRIEERLLPHEEGAVTETTSELLELLSDAQRAPANRELSLRVLGYAVNGNADELALRMLDQLLHALPVSLDITREPQMSSDLVSLVRSKQYGAVCLADLPPSAPTKSRYLVKKLRLAFPELRIIVGRWAHPDLSDETLQPLTEAGASHASRTLLETCRYLADAVGVEAPAPVATASDAA